MPSMGAFRAPSHSAPAPSTGMGSFSRGGGGSPSMGAPSGGGFSRGGGGGGSMNFGRAGGGGSMSFGRAGGGVGGAKLGH